MVNNIWIVSVTHGEYEDECTNILKVYLDEAKANAYKDSIDFWARSNNFHDETPYAEKGSTNRIMKIPFYEHEMWPNNDYRFYVSKHPIED